jgi:hypothetical protein
VLKVRVERVSEVAHHVLADDVVDEGLPQAEPAAEDRHQDHQPGDDQQEPHAVVVAEPVDVGEDLVEHDLDQQWVDEPNRRNDQDQQRHHRNPRLVGSEGVDDAPESSRPSRGFRRLWGHYAIWSSDDFLLPNET